MNFIIEQASESDLPNVYNLSKQFYKHDVYPFSFFYYSLIFWPESFLVAYEGVSPSNSEISLHPSRKFAGYCIAGISQDDPKTSWSLALAVSDEYEAVGLRSQLMVHLHQRLALLGVEVNKVYILPENNLRRMMMGWGYKIVDLESDRMGPGEDRYLMEHQLR